MKSKQELVASIASLRREDLELWIRQSLVRLVEQNGDLVFEDKECARVQLICTLHYDMDVEPDTLPIVLDLIDQLHETRHQLRALSKAVLAQDEQVLTAVLERVKSGEIDRP